MSFTTVSKKSRKPQKLSVTYSDTVYFNRIILPSITFLSHSLFFKYLPQHLRWCIHELYLMVFWLSCIEQWQHYTFILFLLSNSKEKYSYFFIVIEPIGQQYFAKLTIWTGDIDALVFDSMTILRNDYIRDGKIWTNL